MTGHDPFNPPQVPVDPWLQKLIGSPPAFLWWDDGYQLGIAHGHAAGYAEGYDAGLRVLDEAAALLAAQRPDQVVPVQRLRKLRTTYSTPALSAEEIRGRAEASWAAVEDEIRRGRAA